MNTTDACFKPTPGPWIGPAQTGRSGLSAYAITCDEKWLATVNGGSGLPEGESNAVLIAEAGTVYHETGKTPARLAEENRALLEALEECEKAISDNYERARAFNPLVRHCDALLAVRMLIDRTRSAISKAKGGQ